MGEIARRRERDRERESEREREREMFTYIRSSVRLWGGHD